MKSDPHQPIPTHPSSRGHWDQPSDRSKTCVDDVYGWINAGVHSSWGRDPTSRKMYSGL